MYGLDDGLPDETCVDGYDAGARLVHERGAVARQVARSIRKMVTFSIVCVRYTERLAHLSRERG